MPKGDLTAKKGVWNRAGLLACIRCGTSDRPHMARGYCARCYENVVYHENIEREHRKRKVKRLRAPIEKAIADYERERAWKQRNRERALASQKAHYERNKHLLTKWPVGLNVEVLYAGFWCRGKIVERVNRLRVMVKLKGGTQISVGTRNGKSIRRPGQTPVQPEPKPAHVAPIRRQPPTGDYMDLLSAETRASLDQWRESRP